MTANKNSLNENWRSAIKNIFTPKPKYTVELVCYLPFKKEPISIKIDEVSDLEDDRIKKAYEAIRAKHPKSPIRLYSPLGNKTFYENTNSEYQLKVYDKDDNRVDTFSAGTLPQAMAMCEKMWNANPDSYKNIEVIHNNNVITSYNGLEEGFTMNLAAAPDPNEEENKKDNEQNPQQKEIEVNPNDVITTIKDNQGNDVNLSMSQDAQMVSIDGQTIKKDDIDKALEDLVKQVEQNKNNETQDQNNENDEQSSQNDENKEQNDDTDVNNDNQQDKPVDNSQNNDSDQQNEQPQDNQSTDEQQDQADDQQINNNEENTSNEIKDQQQDDSNSEDQDTDQNSNEKQNVSNDQLSDKQKQYMADYENKQNLDKASRYAIDQELKDFDNEAKKNAELKRKSYKDQGGQSFLNKMMNNSVTKELAANALTGLTGGAIAPVFGHHITDHGIDRINAYNKETQRINKAKADWEQKDKDAQARKDKEQELMNQHKQNKPSSAVGFSRENNTTKNKEKIQNAQQKYRQRMMNTINTQKNKKNKSESLTETELEHSWVNQKNDVANIDEFLELARNNIHPSLADTRRPRFHNIFANNESDKYIEIDGQPAEIMVVLDGVEQIKHPKTGEPVNVAIIKEKIPVSINPETGSFTYKDGERHSITFNQFKKLINAPENAEILNKFNKSHPDDPELVLELYKQAKENMDDMYPSWENAYWNEYDLQNYDPIERGKIYLRWKEAQEDRAFQDSHELTADEVKQEFALPKLQKKLEELGSLTGRLDQQAINSLLKQLPESKANELLDKVNEVLEDSYELNLIDTEKKIGEFMSTTPALLACENIINKLSDNALQKLEDNIPEDKEDEFESKKAALLNKYIKKAILHGVTRVITDPTIVSHKNEIIKDLDDLRKEYGISKWGMNVKQVKQMHEPSEKQFDGIKSEYSYDPEEVEYVKRELDALKTNNYQLKSEIEKLEYQFENGLISKEDVFTKMKELTNLEDSSWKDIVNASFSNNKNDADNGIGILDRIDRSLKAYKDIDTKGMRISDKYHKLLDDILDQLKTQYPEGNEEELGDIIKTWYNQTLKPEIAKDTSVDKKLKNYVVTDQISDDSEKQD